MWKKPVLFNALVSLLILVSLLTRLPHLNGSFWLDEAAQIAESARPLTQQLEIRGDFQPPLLHLSTFLTRQVSYAEWWLRLWGAVIPSLVASWAVFELFKIWWPDFKASKAKLSWLGLLLATNSLWVFYSQELRPYSLAVMWTCLSWLAIVKLTNQLDTKHNWICWVLSVLGGLYSTYLFPFVLVSQSLYLLWQAKLQPKLWRGLAIACLTVAAGFAPWVPSFLGQLNEGQQLRLDLPGWDQVVSTTQLKALPLAAGKFLFGVVDLEFTPGFLLPTAVLGLVFGMILWQVWQRRQLLSPQTRQAIVVLSWWLILPILLAWLVSFKIPVIQPKRILFVLPAIYGLITILALEIKFKFNLGKILLASLLAINIWSLSQYYLNPDYQREDWRGLRAELVADYPVARTATVFSFPGPFAGWGWYDQNQIYSYNLGYLSNPGHVDVSNELKAASDKFDYLLVFDYIETLTDPQRAVKSALHNLGWQEIASVQRPGIGKVRVYAKPQNLLGLNSFK